MPEQLRPLCIDIELGGLMAVPERHPILLDAVLLALQDQRRALPFAAEALPVQVVRDASWPGEAFCWLASALDVEWAGPTTDRIMHRNARPMELLDHVASHGATTVDFDRGLTKVSRKRLAVRQAMRARAWCIGDQEALEGLLERLQALGAHRHLGLGLVRAVKVSQDPEARRKSWCRPLPCSSAHGDPYTGQRYRSAGRATPPYWDRDLSMQAWWPSAAT